MKRTIIIFTLILVGLFGFYKLGSLLAPGSYPYAETYELNFSEVNVINAIEKLKTDHPDLVVPINMNGGRRDSLDHWYHIYLYYKDKNEIINCWTRPINKIKTRFAFVGVNEGLELGNWKIVNKDFGFFDNRNVKKEFEDRILLVLKNELENKTHSH